MKKAMIICISIIVIFIFFSPTITYADEYYVSNSGDDSNSGKSPHKPWRTVEKVNNYGFKPGDIIHFRRGDVWREQLRPIGGNENGYVQYTSYGIGEKPTFVGSVDRSEAKHWEYTGNNIWAFSTAEKVEPFGSNIPIEKLTFWKKNGTNINSRIINNPTGQKTIKIEAVNSGDLVYDVQLTLRGLKIVTGKNYVFTFRARSTEEMKIPYISLMRDRVPWSDSSSSYTDRSPYIHTDWNVYSINYTADADDDNARITMYLGSSMKNGMELYIDNVSFLEAPDMEIYTDVGNIIFDDGKGFGIKVFKENELNMQNEFWYDKEKHVVKMYSNTNPTELYKNIECALTRNIINIVGKSHVLLKGLAVKYGSAHGINCFETHHIEINDCEISYIGGGELNLAGNVYRYGNGVEFFNNAHDNLVEGCSIWEIFDSALTNQGTMDGNEQYNITYRNNNIWNAQWSYELWNHDLNSTIKNIYFEDNICKNAGYGWSRWQRGDKEGGIHLCFFNNTAQASNVFIRNNIFENAEEMCFYLSSIWNGEENLIMENNLYIQPKNRLIVRYNDKSYHAESFKQYKSTTGKDSNSKWIDYNEKDRSISIKQLIKKFLEE